MSVYILVSMYWDSSGRVQDRLLRVISPRSSLPDGVMKYISDNGKTLINWLDYTYSEAYVDIQVCDMTDSSVDPQYLYHLKLSTTDGPPPSL